jgi:hypothetical protein
MEFTAEIPVVCRSPGMEPDALTRYWEGLDRVTFARAVTRERQAAKERDLLFAAHGPIRKLIEEDENAMVALREFAGLRKAAVKDRAVSFLSKAGGLGGITSFGLPPGLHIFGPPFDLDRPGPTAGAPAESHASRDTVELFVCVPDDSDAHGLRVATASLVIIFQPSIIGTLSVRPYTKYAYSWLVAGLHLSAHSEGSLTITAVRENDGQVQDSRTVLLWSRTTESDVHSESTDGVAWPPDFQVNFLAEPGRRYLVSITATVSGDQSGDQSILAFPSWSVFSGCLSASVPWLVAELRQ